MKHLIRKLLPIVFLSLTLISSAQDNYKLMIDYQFDYVYPISKNGLTPVRKGDNVTGKWGYIDKTGKLVIDYRFDSALSFSDNGLAPVRRGDPETGKWGYIDKTGKLVIDFKFDLATVFVKNGLALVRKGDEKTGKCGYIDKTGKLIIDYQFDNGRAFSDNGLAPVRKGDEKNGKWGYINQSGKFVIACRFDEALPFFNNDLAVVRKGDDKSGKWGYIDQTGKLVIDYQFDYTDPFSKNVLARVRKGDNITGKWGYIDQAGKLVIDYQFDYALSFPESGMAAVRKGDNVSGKWGYINQTGKLAIDYQFDNARSFSENGLASVCKGNEKSGKWGYIDQTGKLVVDYQFDYINSFNENGLAAVRKGDNVSGKWGFICPTSPKDEITSYIETEINKWQEKGKYETTADYKIRVSEQNRKKRLEELSIIAVQNIAPKYCDWKTITSEYDPDNQTSKINIKGLPAIYLKVPLNEAESFDNSISAIQPEGLQYALGSDARFFLQKAVFKNPNNGKTYSYSSTDKAVFAYTQLNMNFEPLSIDLQATDNPNLVKTETNTVSVGSSDVDVNIPVNQFTNDKTFAVIIANENYLREVKVQFANNDGRIFKEYCQKTLGIPSKNIHISFDATFGTMISEINWLSDVAQAYNGQAKIIFYYAGHGMPNESDKSAFLLPADGVSTDYVTSLKLEDVYNRLGQYPAQNVTVILDACFSGSVRDNGMLADARSVRIKPKTENLKGRLIVLSAATGDETAYPYKEKQHGLFTYFLLKKLKESKGDVDYNSLSNYIIENVKQQSIVVNQKSQTPQVITSPEIQNSWKLMNFK